VHTLIMNNTVFCSLYIYNRENLIEHAQVQARWE